MKLSSTLRNMRSNKARSSYSSAGVGSQPIAPLKQNTRDVLPRGIQKKPTVDALLIEVDLSVLARFHCAQSGGQLLHGSREIFPHVDRPGVLAKAGYEELHVPFKDFTYLCQDGADVLQLRIVGAHLEPGIKGVRNPELNVHGLK